MKRISYWLFIFIFFHISNCFSQIGVTIHNPNKVDDCYRLISSRNLEAAHLLTPKGRYIHSWFHQHTDEQTSGFGGFGMTWHYAGMLPNGNLMAIIKDEMIIELDWNSNLVWKAKLRAHHDFVRTKEGHTIVVSRKDTDNPWQAGKKLAMDELVEFDQNGTGIWHWKYEDHLDEFKQFVNQPLPPHKSFKDWPHINTCEIIPENPSAQKDDRFKSGNLLLCGRHSNTIFVVEKESGEVVWAWGPGEIEGPHLPTMLENGNILIYDNGRHLKEKARGYTRIIELDPLKEKIVWQYTGSPKKSFFSPSRGSANRLQNGNTLIAESDSGHLFEITSNGEIVWEYWNSDIKKDGNRMPLYRTIPYEKEIVEPLLDRYGRIKDVLEKHNETLRVKKFGRNDQYKKIVREAVFFIEVGYYDLAQQLLDRLMKVFPDEPEGYFGYSLVFAARKDPARAFENMQKAIERGMPLDRFTCGLSKIFHPLVDSELFKKFIESRDHVLIHGPMVGDIRSNSAKIWVRTFGQKSVQVIARLKGINDFNIKSKTINTKTENENTGIIILDGLAPFTIYEYKLIVEGKDQEKIFQFQTFPPKGQPAKFFTGFGGGAGYTPKYQYMWDTIHSHNLPFFLMLGDNVYIDHPERPATQQYCYYRIQSRPEYRRFQSNTAIYAIWDDHDFTFNDGKGSPFRDDPPWKRKVLNLFKNQWNNPYYGGGEKYPGCWFDFSYGDVDFFMLDCRYYREQPKGNPAASMLGKVQKQWLFEKLKNSTATFKVIASSVPWAKGTKPGSLDTWDGHHEEREEIFGFIEKQKIEGIILISADRHRSDAWRIKRPNGYDFYDLESSKLTNIHTHKIMPGALFGYNKKCSFALLEFDTTCDDPKVVYRIKSIDNEEIHRLTIFRSDLCFKKK
jgi:alkaline phosphatase D